MKNLLTSSAAILNDRSRMTKAYKQHLNKGTANWERRGQLINSNELKFVGVLKGKAFHDLDRRHQVN